MRITTLLSTASLLGSLFSSGAALAADEAWKIDYANFEQSGACPALLQEATGYDAIKSWNQDKLDKVYACAKAGPMPNGFMAGKVIFAPGGNFDNLATYMGNLGVPLNKTAFKIFAESLWKGKHFYRDQGALLNQMGDALPPMLGVAVSGQKRFPAKLYCGQSLFDSRRESNIIDYMFSDKVKIDGQSPYLDSIDWIAGGKSASGKNGLKVRDEIRMLKPGFYLGRAYLDRVFVLNFTLTAEQPVDGDDKCWGGYQ